MTNNTTHPNSPSELRERLRKGQAWLTKAKADLADMPDMGVGSKLEEQFNLAFITWATFETTWRVVSNSNACVVGFECDPESPAVCQVCAKEDK
jgi:hypothetical protein